MSDRPPPTALRSGRSELDAKPDRARQADDRFRPDDGEGLGPTAPETAQQDPEDPVRGPDVGVPPPGQGDELLAEGQVLEDEITSGARGRKERRQKGYEEAEHRAGEDPGPGENRQ